jgi:hypothetical protein
MTADTGRLMGDRQDVVISGGAGHAVGLERVRGVISQVGMEPGAVTGQLRPGSRSGQHEYP